MSSHSLHSNRLVLRRWRDSDVEDFAALNADPQVMQHFPAVLGREESVAMAARIAEHFRVHDFGLWAVEVIGGPAFIGFVGLAHTRFDVPFAPAVELGWRLSRAHWGRGYATEAARCALDYGFGTLALNEIVSFTVAANVRSWSVMERIGMRRDAEGDFDHPLLPVGHALRRHVLYRALRPASYACSSSTPPGTTA